MLPRLPVLTEKTAMPITIDSVSGIAPISSYHIEQAYQKHVTSHACGRGLAATDRSNPVK